MPARIAAAADGAERPTGVRAPTPTMATELDTPLLLHCRQVDVVDCVAAGQSGVPDHAHPWVVGLDDDGVKLRPMLDGRALRVRTKVRLKPEPELEFDLPAEPPVEPPPPTPPAEPSVASEEHAVDHWPPHQDTPLFAAGVSTIGVGGSILVGAAIGLPIAIADDSNRVPNIAYAAPALGVAAIVTGAILLRVNKKRHSAHLTSVAPLSGRF